MNIGRESEVLEFKKSTSEVNESMDDICAILNKHGAGIIYYGVKPNGDVVGQNIGFSTLDDIGRVCKEAIKPMIYPEISEVEFEGRKCIKVVFQGNERPYSAFGRYYKRVTDRSEEMIPEELKNIMSETDYSSKWENNLTKYGLESVDSKALKSFYNTAISCGRLDELEVYDEKELLVGLGLMENDRLNNAGYYLFSNKKPVVLKIATYVTDERVNFSDIRRIEDNIYNLIRYGYSYIKEKMSWRVELGDNTSRIEIPEIPIEAIREIVVNSFAHANYRGITENEIVITPTQIEIYNPGEFPINLNPEMFVNLRRKSQPRNKVILNTLFKCKDVEMFGSGFKKVYSLCNDKKVKVEYEINDDGFFFIFYRHNEITRTEIYKDIPTYIPIKLSNNETKVLIALKDNPTLTRNELALIVGVDVRTIQRCLDKLVQNNKIIRIGSRKTGYWEVSNN